MRSRFGRRGGVGRVASAVGAVLAAGMLMGAAGCSDDSTSANGEATATSVASGAPASTTAASNTAWNPCSIPDADIAAAGLNPEKRQADTGKYGTKFPGWDICGWLSDSWYSINVYSTSDHTYDEVIHNTNNFSNPRNVTVGGRNAVMMDSLTLPEGCDLIFDSASGPVQIELGPMVGADEPGDSCTEVTRVAEVLLKDFPQ
ncbi:DUF3558 domain-containing protein [Nocardia vermiculata]|uniref:DUF3558 domain-containing protein n=1 Tax=Nocardia vermiculata TaxID=257274 RepID=A0A846Y9N6_9NOCA|nr:DUF3558 domain-containing protein [Nocardia vermiculata]